MLIRRICLLLAHDYFSGSVTAVVLILQFHILCSISINLYTPITYDYAYFIYSYRLFLLLCFVSRNATTEMIQLAVQFLILYSGLQSIKQVIF